jgi:hypothetical protein
MDAPTVPDDGAKAMKPPTTPIEAPAIEGTVTMDTLIALTDEFTGPMNVSIDEAADPGDTTGDAAIHPSPADNGKVTVDTSTAPADELTGLVMNTPSNEAAVPSVNTDDAAVHASPRGEGTVHRHINGSS